MTGGRLAAWTAWAAGLWTLLASPPSLFAFFENALLRALLLGLAVALWHGRRELAQVRSAWLDGALVLAAVLRWGAEALPWHGYNWLEILARRVVDEPEPDTYANGFGVFMRVPFAFRHDLEWAIFNGNRAAGLLLVAATAWLSYALTQDRRASAASALVMAVLPLAVRLEASESMQPVPALCAVLALAAFATHARTGRGALAVAGGLALAYAGLSRPEALVVAAAVPLAYVPAREHARAGAVALAVSLSVSVPLAWLGAHALSTQLGGPATFVVTPEAMLSTWREALATAGTPHLPLALVGVAGLMALLVTRRWGAAAVLVALAGRVAVAGFDQTFSNRWQLAYAGWPYLAVGVGALVVLLPERARAAGLVGVLVGVGGASAGAPFWGAAFDQQAEYRFLRDARTIATLGPRSGLVRAVREAGEGLGAWFPTYRLDQGTPLWSLRDLAGGGVEPPVTYYRGLWCWTPEGLAPACRQVEERFALERLEGAVLTGPTYMGPGHPEGAEVAFFRVVGRSSGIRPGGPLPLLPQPALPRADAPERASP